MLTHERAPSTLTELDTHASLVDLIDMNLALDVHDELAHRVAEDHRRKQEEADRKAARRR